MYSEFRCICDSAAAFRAPTRKFIDAKIWYLNFVPWKHEIRGLINERHDGK